MKTTVNNISIIILMIGAVCFLQPLMAQSTNTEYFMKSAESKTSLNPALRPEQGYIGVPFLSNLYFDYKTNTFNLDHFLFPGNPQAKTFLHEDITAEQFLSKISNNNYLTADFSYTLAALGFYKGKGFWSVDLGIKSFADINIPYDLFKFAKQGFTTSAGDRIEGYDLKNIRASVNAYAELGVAHSRPFLNNKLIVGLKAKLLLGLANMNLNVKRLSMNTGSDLWTIESEAMMEASLPGYKPDYDENGVFNGFTDNGGFGGLAGYGLGFDLGATYKLSGIIDNKLMDRFTISAALTDLGFIHWSSGSSMYLGTKPSKTTIAGNYEINFGSSENNLGDQFSAIKDTLQNALNLVETGKTGGRATGLRMNMNWGLEYEIIKNKLSAGILSTTHFNPSHTVTEVTMAGTYKPVRWFEAGLSYSFVHSNFNTFGLALNFVPSKGVHLFLASDYVIPHVNSDYIPTTSKALNFQFGISIPMGGKRVRQ